MFRRQYAQFVIAATVLMTMQPLLTMATKVDGRYLFSQVMGPYFCYQHRPACSHPLITMQ